MDAAFGALVQDLDQGLVDDVGDLVDDQRNAARDAKVVAHARACGQVGDRQRPDGRSHRRVGQRVEAHVEHVATALDLLEIHDRALVCQIKRVGRQAPTQVTRGEHRQDRQQVGGDLLVVLAVVAEDPDLRVDDLVALVLGNVLFVVRDAGHELGSRDLGRTLDLTAHGRLHQRAHLLQVAPGRAE